MRRWLEWHSIRGHIAAPIWLRVPERQRWRIASWLNRSKRFCWADLVSDALAYPEDDACDVHVPSLTGNRAPQCASVCDWAHDSHRGKHPCSCYCGKFQFKATEGALDRRDAWLAPAPVGSDEGSDR